MSRLLIVCLTFLSISLLNAQSPNANSKALKDVPVAVEATLEDLADFNKWKQNNGKKFDSAEDKYRFLVFKQNKKIVKEHNDKKEKKFKMGLNQFAAETKEEFALKHLGAKPPNREEYLKQIRNKKEGEIISPVQIPTLEQLQALIEQQKQAQQTSAQAQTTSNTPGNNGNGKGKANGRNLQIVAPPNPTPVNWKTNGKVTPVLNQGSCGSCYAFSAVGALESAYLIERNQTVGLSQQQLVDCSIFLGNEACSGGWPDYAYNYIIYYNITSRVNYPYINNHIYCQQVGGEYQLRTYIYTEQGCPGLIKEVQNRPLAVPVDALPWQLYQSGVFNQCNDPSQTNLNHAVVLVGYDANQNWIIKNSWGAGWGQQGYITLEAGNSCGICDFPGASPYL